MHFFLWIILLLTPAVFAQPQPPDTLWTYTYATSGSDEAFAVASAPDGRIVIGGKELTLDYVSSALLVCLDDRGQHVWNRRYEGFRGSIKDVAVTVDGGITFTGACSSTQGMIRVVKTSESGEIQWSRCYWSSTAGEGGVSIVPAADGGLAVLAVGSVLPSDSIFLLKLDMNGDSLWTQTFGSPALYKAGAVALTTDGGFVVGSSQNWQAFVAKTDSAGNIEWQTTFGDGQLEEQIHIVLELAEGGYLVAGTQTRGTWTENPWAAKLTADGDTLWTRAYPQLGPGWLRGGGEPLSGYYVLGGSTGFDYLLMMLDANGQVVWDTTYGTSISDDGHAMSLLPDGGIVLAGHWHTSVEYSQDIWVVRTQSVTSDVAPGYIRHSEPKNLMVYPNPFNSQTSIQVYLDKGSAVQLRVYDLLGRLVQEQPLGRYVSGQHRFVFNGSHLASGYYLVTLYTEQGRITSKVTLIR